MNDYDDWRRRVYLYKVDSRRVYENNKVLLRSDVISPAAGDPSDKRAE